MNIVGNSWDEILKEEYSKDYFIKIREFLDKEYAEKTIFPSRENIFRALKLVDFNDVRVVILGQDPYHGEGQANGMAFSVNDGVPLPPSLVNIFKELQSDLGIKIHGGGNLEGWATQGVLLLNSVLTVRKGEALSHSNIGWQCFTDAVIKSLNAARSAIVFILWGAGAISKKQLISSHHHIITSPHPSPLSAYRGFFGSKPFSATNEFLTKNSLPAIDWGFTAPLTQATYYTNCKSITRI